MIHTQSIIFIGLMGAGKTTIGRFLAKNIRCEFFDTDKEIEKRTGASIPLIFELEGEDGFRKRERTIIAELCEKQKIVLATGGGAILDKKNRSKLAQSGYIIYLYSDIEQIFERIGKDKNRPLLQTKDPKQRLFELIEQRDPIYTQLADWKLETTTNDTSHIVDLIIDKLNLL